jgi:predicted enzyme related to lactoylglutathione lyase
MSSLDAKERIVNTDNYRADVPYRAELARTDPAAAALFYEAMFGWHLPASGTGVCEIGGVAVSAIATAATDQSSRWTTYVYAEDLEAAHDRGIAAGGTQFEAPRASASGRQVAKVADPSGAVIGLFEPGASCAALVNEPGALTGGELITDDAQASAELAGRVRLGVERTCRPLNRRERRVDGRRRSS